MCNVCIASEILRLSTCHPTSPKCPAFNDGYQVDFGPGKTHRVSHRAYYKPRRGKARLTHVGFHPRTVFIRALGKNPEGPAKFQIRRSGEPWPRQWSETLDLAGVVSAYGLEMGWGWLTPPMKRWVLGKRPDAPTEAEIEAFYERRSARAGPRALRARHARLRRRRSRPLVNRAYLRRRSRLRKRNRQRAAIKVEEAKLEQKARETAAEMKRLRAAKGA